MQARDEIYIPYLAPPRKSKTKPSPPIFQIGRHSKCLLFRTVSLSEWSWPRRMSIYGLLAQAVDIRNRMWKLIYTGGSLCGPPVEISFHMRFLMSTVCANSP